MRRCLFLLVLVAGCAKEPVDPWLGSYDISIEERVWPCGDPSATPFVSNAQRTWMLERASADAFSLYGQCPILATVETPTRAEFEPTSCDATAPSGARVHVEVLSGFLFREGANIWGEIVTEATTDSGACGRSVAEISGSRF